jgi:hypothetical protein
MVVKITKIKASILDENLSIECRELLLYIYIEFGWRLSGIDFGSNKSACTFI